MFVSEGEDFQPKERKTCRAPCVCACKDESCWENAECSRWRRRVSRSWESREPLNSPGVRRVKGAERNEGEANGYCVRSVEGGTGRGTRRLAGWDSGRLLGER